MTRNRGRSGRRPPHRDATRRGRSRDSAPAHAATTDPATTELMRDVRVMLRNDDPTVFLVYASAIVAAARHTGTTLPEGWIGLIDSFMEIDLAETTALLHVAAVLSADELQRRRVLAALERRRQPMPPAVTGLSEAKVTSAYFLGDELGDGDNVILGIDLAEELAITATVYVDHNMGTIVKDAFFIGEPVASVVQRYLEIMREQGEQVTALPPMDLADARLRIEHAVMKLDELHPDWEQDQWPMCRPLLEHLLTTMPQGGRGYEDFLDLDDAVSERIDWDVDEDLVADFLASPQAHGLPRSEAVVAAAHDLFAAAESHGDDALRWSPVVVEVVLRELAFDPFVSEDALDQLPQVLPAIVRFAHRERRVSAASTIETMAVIPHWLDVLAHFRATGVTAALRHSDALLASALSGDFQALHREMLLRELGSPEAVESLDDTRLPDEVLDLTQVPEDLRDRVSVISGHIDRLVEAGLEGLDTEFRTACRRFLTRVSQRDPEVLRRRAKDLNTAATIAWHIARENELIGYPPARVTAKTLTEFFGVAAGSARAETLHAAYCGGSRYGPRRGLGADLLVSRCRRRLIDLRDRHWPED